MAPRDSVAPEHELMNELFLGMRLHGIDYRRIEVSPPFGFSFGEAPGRALFHYIVAGTVFLREADGQIHTLAPGTAVLLPRGGVHQLLSATDLACQDIKAIAAVPVADNLLDITACNGRIGCPNNVVLFSSCMEFELGGMQSLVRLMPPVMRVETLSDRHPEILPILSAMESEVRGRRVGFAGILGRLADVVSAVIIRSWIECGCNGASGLVDALREPRLSRAIAALHRDPGRDWTVASLAAEAGVSRTVFAERFQSLTGATPLRYVAELRMRLALEWMRRDRISIDVAAHRLGYASQAAFSRAFKRVTGHPPRAAHLASEAPALASTAR